MKLMLGSRKYSIASRGGLPERGHIGEGAKLRVGLKREFRIAYIIKILMNFLHKVYLQLTETLNIRFK